MNTQNNTQKFIRKPSFKRGNTVWILGAGSSKDAEYPLVGEFLDRDYFERWFLRVEFEDPYQIARKTFEPQLERFIKLDRNLNRLMSNLLESGVIEDITAINDFVLNVINSIQESHRNGVYHMPYAFAFAQLLACTNSSVISFNYDTLVEEQLTSMYISSLAHDHNRSISGLKDPGIDLPCFSEDKRFPYRLQLRPDSYISPIEESLIDIGSGYLPSNPPCNGRIPFLKLHGSVGWWFCPICKITVYAPHPGNRSIFWDRCPKCSKSTKLPPLFVPPASDSKFPTWNLLESLWFDAESEIYSADQLIFAGYSLPEEDRRARELFSLVSCNKPELPVLVIDPSSGLDSIRARFLDIFKYVDFAEMTFRDFISLVSTYRTSFHCKQSDQLLRSEKNHLQIMFENAVDKKKVLSCCVPAQSPLDEVILDKKTLVGRREASVKILGLSKYKQAQKIIRNFIKEGDDDYLRGLCIQGLGDNPDQEAVDIISQYMLDISPISSFVRDRGELPFPLSLYAMVAARNAILLKPELDYRRIILSCNLLIQTSETSIFGQSASGILRIIGNRAAIQAINIGARFDSIPVAVNLPTIKLRSKPIEYSSMDEIRSTLCSKGLFDIVYNSEAAGSKHDYKSIIIKQSDYIIIDNNTGLIWQLAGSPTPLPIRDISEYLDDLNRRGYGGLFKWRLPTVEEAMSLMQPGRQNIYIHISPFFNVTQTRIWTSDNVQGVVIVVDFAEGRCDPAWTFEYGDICFVRAVVSSSNS